MRRWRILLLSVLTIVLAGLLTTGMWAATRSSGPPSGTMMGHGYGSGMMDRSGMMGGLGLAGNGQRVDTLAAARVRAQAFADRLTLRVGEVMQFTDGYYAELTTVDGARATEVLVDPYDGAVQIEFGPAMMWNTSYGMHAAAAAGGNDVSADDAAAIAQRWLSDQRPGLTVGEPERFPGYFTLHTLRDGTITGMMSVNAATGAVWYHTWHGRYVAMSED